MALYDRGRTRPSRNGILWIVVAVVAVFFFAFLFLDDRDTSQSLDNPVTQSPNMPSPVPPYRVNQ